MRAFLILALICIIGCGPPEDDSRTQSPWNEQDAVRVVWIESMQMEWAQLPEIVWRRPEGCAPDGLSGFMYNGNCLAGLYWADTNRIELVWRGSFAQSAWAHELNHAYHWLRFHGVDYEHKDPSWQTWVPQMNAYLEEMGL